MNKMIVMSREFATGILGAMQYGRHGAGGAHNNVFEAFAKLLGIDAQAPSPAAEAVPVAIFEGWEDYGNRQRPLITVTGNLHAGDALYVRQQSPAMQDARIAELIDILKGALAADLRPLHSREWLARADAAIAASEQEGR